jgi:hydroxyacylglutathione hydrolase
MDRKIQRGEIMIFHQIPCGGDRNYGYLMACETTGRACVIDPSPDPQPCFEKARQLRLSIDYIVNTHSHFDHTSGNRFFKEKCDAAVVAHESVSYADIGVSDRGKLELGDIQLLFLHTPGHTADSICILADKMLVTGDTLFVGKVGGTHTAEAHKQEFASLKRLMDLTEDIQVWPGHNYGVRPTSTIGEERQSNPFCLRLNSFDDFVWLKENWAAYKLEHNIS